MGGAGQADDAAMKLAAIMLSAAALAAPLAAQAQSPLEALAGLRFCKTLKDDAQRLKCYDSLMPAAAAPAAVEPQAAREWKIEESKSPLDDSPQVTASILNEGDKVALVLRCREHKTDVMAGSPFTYLGSNKPIRVIVRINDGKPIETAWSPSTTGTAAFAPSPVQFIQALPNGGHLFLRLFGFDGRQADGEFALANVAAVRDKIAAACRWPSAAH